MLCVKAPATNVVFEPRTTPPLIVSAPPAVAVAVPAVVKVPAIAIAELGIVFVPLPLRVRLP